MADFGIVGELLSHWYQLGVKGYGGAEKWRRKMLISDAIMRWASYQLVNDDGVDRF